MTIRKKFICDIVDNYKKNHPEEFAEFIKATEIRRSNANDKKFAQIKGTSEIRLAASIPEGIMNVFKETLKEEPIFEPKGELKWFLKKYPEFLIPRSY